MKTKPQKAKKVHIKADGSWDTTDLYRNDQRNPFNIEWLKYFNPREGRDQIMFLYSDKNTGKIVKYRVLR
jgi:hypothetical protein